MRNHLLYMNTLPKKLGINIKKQLSLHSCEIAQAVSHYGMRV